MEKLFGTKKAWSKNKTAIKNKTMLAVMTSILVVMFEIKNLEKFGI